MRSSVAGFLAFFYVVRNWTRILFECLIFRKRKKYTVSHDFARREKR